MDTNNKTQRTPSMEDFRSENWKALTPNERLESLQYLENSMAAEAGRPPRKVVDKNLGSDTFGYYSEGMFDKNKIYINQNYLLAEPSNEKWNQFSAMDTVIHEGRHAYQHDCVKGKIAPQKDDENKITDWKKNSKIYNDYKQDYEGFSRYRFQPKEVDAHDFANEKMQSFGERFSDDKNYTNYIENNNKINEQNVQRAKDYVGENYQDEIRNKINEKYNNRYRFWDRSSGLDNFQAIETSKPSAEKPIDISQQKDNEIKFHNYADKTYGDEYRQKHNELLAKDPEYRNLYQQAYSNDKLPPIDTNISNNEKNPSHSFKSGSTNLSEKSQTGTLSSQNNAGITQKNNASQDTLKNTPIAQQQRDSSSITANKKEAAPTPTSNEQTGKVSAEPTQQKPIAESKGTTTEKAATDGTVRSVENNQRGSLPAQKDAVSAANKTAEPAKAPKETKPEVPQGNKSSDKTAQQPSKSESNSQSGAERGQKGAENQNKQQNGNSAPRGERPQEASQNASNGTTKRGTPPGSTGGEDSKAPTSSSSNPNDKVSASSNSAKAADEASKVASDQAAQNVAPKPNGMGM